MNNPNLVHDGMTTRFGQPGGPDPRGNIARVQPWSIHHNLRRLMAYPLQGQRTPTSDELLTWLSGPKKQPITLAMLTAVQYVIEALHDGPAMIRMLRKLEADPLIKDE